MSKEEPLIGIMHGVKQLLDPNGILNPHKVLPTARCDDASQTK